MEEEEPKNKLKKPFTEYGRYSYADYLSWQMDEMVELIKGKVFRSAAAAPRRIHQEISGKVFNKLFNFLEKHPCKVYEAPFDVRLPVKSKKNEDIDTVVQPDICVICDTRKLDDLGCIGAPDLIVEILSPGSNKKELKYKYEVYEESGVLEYWIIHPDEQTVMAYTLKEGKYIPSRLMTSGDVVRSVSISGFQLDLKYVFKDLD
ncbi:Endonuclease, Uma2 family (restriction endonuclease fold) [Cyclobacterium lianum]|uniref:Endonuclease, Uma2 family (Restriction endonuclease fold) n=1 Tax=Cyclobacterium lianum TaxID=388280 RepID=A0A1M7QHS0_9BACT|nr:Uma2 family endonuclease [Cyclobacterium lianum]SHN30597.1 Endonuclease, Uma2 family (restriction endonuclease fold) [Cyclobacterium lianum]